ncbi:protease complex subunit PrcB family protein [Bacillus sp. 31A1R]|uniref:Protease complex subunit PrcB family protein n=1 Tax=Robertmurraya mangrovi TaxID=3098077 RepID=A0ABU5IWJ1_9BACI|nr:protease complex subunit PrcB family protein [Bacillus sp. 31A1R]MDZ5471529.1 protease complex subunit PrcB family protein [Bacillus sp. 31A1R]
MKKALLPLLVIFLFFSGMSGTAVFASNHEGTHQFESVDETNLSEVEKEFVQLAKQQKGVYQYGSLYVIALGPQPNSGYDLILDKQEQIFEQLKVYVKSTHPEPGYVYTDAIVYPYVIGRLNLPPYTTLTVLDSATNDIFSKEQSPIHFAKTTITTNTSKVWTFTEKKSLKKSTLKKYKIYVEKLGDEKKRHPVKVEIDKKNKKRILVTPTTPYEKGASYLLYFNNGKGTKKYIPFEVKSKEKNIELSYDFTKELNGWVGDFADLPVNYEKEQYELQFGLHSIPVKGEVLRKGLLLSGMNRSDDLFMFAKKKLGKSDGLQPNTTYNLNMEVEFYTNVDPGLVGVGGSPGEGVHVKAGASNVEPKPTKLGNDWRMNINKGEQATSGTNGMVIGDIAKLSETGESYEKKKLQLTTPMKVKTNSKGELWVFFGTDSGFEGKTTLYYSNVKVKLEKR